MEKFSLAEALRYITAGFVFVGGLWIYSPNDATQLMNALGPVGIVGFSLAFGAVLYPVYRGLLYNLFMPKLQDLTRKNTNSYRTYLQREYGVKNASTATRLYVALRDLNLKNVFPAADATIANVHLGYMAALIFLLFGLASLPCITNFLRFFLIFAIVSFGTFLFERRFQYDELSIFLAECNDDTIRQTADKLGIKLKQEQAKSLAVPAEQVNQGDG